MLLRLHSIHVHIRIPDIGLPTEQINIFDPHHVSFLHVRFQCIFIPNTRPDLTISRVFAAVAALSAGAFAVPSAAVAGTACCSNLGDCSTVSGTTDGGLHW